MEAATLQVSHRKACTSPSVFARSHNSVPCLLAPGSRPRVDYSWRGGRFNKVAQRQPLSPPAAACRRADSWCVFRPGSSRDRSSQAGGPGDPQPLLWLPGAVHACCISGRVAQPCCVVAAVQRRCGAATKMQAMQVGRVLRLATWSSLCQWLPCQCLLIAALPADSYPAC